MASALVTSDWREPPHPHPESSLTGTLYESNPVSAPYVVASPHAWMFAGTGVRKGTRFRGLVGIEYDRVNPGSPVERPIEVLSHSPVTCRGVHSYADSAYYTHHGGAGVFNAGTMRWVASFSGPYQYGMNRHTGDFTRDVTANLLRAFADGPAAAKYPAHDNLAAIHEAQGRYIIAEPLYKRALSIRERVLGPDHPSVGTTRTIEMGDQSRGKLAPDLPGAKTDDRQSNPHECNQCLKIVPRSWLNGGHHSALPSRSFTVSPSSFSSPAISDHGRT